MGRHRAAKTGRGKRQKGSRKSLVIWPGILGASRWLIHLSFRRTRDSPNWPITSDLGDLLSVRLHYTAKLSLASSSKRQLNLSPCAFSVQSRLIIHSTSRHRVNSYFKGVCPLPFPLPLSSAVKNLEEKFQGNAPAENSTNSGLAASFRQETRVDCVQRFCSAGGHAFANARK